MSSSGGDGLSGGVMYNWRVAAVHNALAQNGKATGPLTLEDLTRLGHLDQYHYLGVEACDDLIHTLGLSAGTKVLDVGSGIGGPARYIAGTSGCDISGVELQADLCEAATDLTLRVGLADRVRFLCGDFSTVVAGDAQLKESFDHVMSLLSFCHFPDRDGALKVCFDAMKPGGTFFFEDLALVGPSFTEQEDQHLKQIVGCPALTSFQDYEAALERAGFVDIQVVDMTETWKKWTKARHESFRASREQTVKLHGEKLFESRCRFYEVIDELFRGNLGGARITGRKPGATEVKLSAGRSTLSGMKRKRSTDAVLNEFGDSDTAEPKAPEMTNDPGLAQPLLPAGPETAETQYHDSLQYHFFLPGMFIAGRVFHTKTLQQHSAWMYDMASGKMTELFEPSYDVMAQKPGDEHMNLDSKHLHITDAPNAGSFVVKGRGISVSFKQHNVYSWAVGNFREAVIHRPDLTCTAVIDGKELQGTGYSKRYFGLYPRFWGYRFMHGATLGDENKHHFWTADAAFGDLKYNYFKVLTPQKVLLAAESKDTWQQDTSAYGFIDGVRHEVRLVPICTWETVIGGPGHNMESKMQNRYCEVELIVGGKRLRGMAYNERCYGTVG